MNSKIYNTDKMLSEKNRIQKINIEENINVKSQEENLINTKNDIQEKTKTPNVQHGNKLLTFIKTKLILFAFIFGTVGIITIAITVPLALKNKNKNSNNEKNDNDNTIYDNLPKINDVISISNRKIFDFSDIRISTANLYNNINDQREACSEIDCFCSYLQGISSGKSDKEKVYLTYKWIADNIKFDIDKYISGESVECEVDQVYNNNKTISSGYAQLFKHLLTCFQFNNDIYNIQGHSKGFNYNIETIMTDADTDHEWNAVKIEGEWCLIDTTLGAGFIVNGEFKKNYSEYYLCTLPEQFVRKNLPKESQKHLQALEQPIDLYTFQNLAPTQPAFFENGFIGLAYDKAIQNICGRGRIILKFDENKDSIPKLSITLKKDNVNKINWYSYKKTNNNYFYIDFYINEQGNYDLKIAIEISYINYDIVNFKIKCDSSPEEEHSFPIFSDTYRNEDNVELIYPIYRDLEKGKKYNFKIWAPEKDEVYLYLVTSTTSTALENILMEKEGEYFTKNDVMIYKGSILIKVKQSNLFTTYVTYSSK